MKFFMVICPVLGMLFSGCRSSFDMVTAVKDFDAARYCGIWYEIARLPNWFQRGMYHVSAEYTPSGNGRIRVVNQGFDAAGKRRMVIGRARMASAAKEGELEVSFFKPFWNSYRVIYLNSDYTIAAVCGKSPDHLWILSRRKNLSPSELKPVITFLKQHGFAVGELMYSGE